MPKADCVLSTPPINTSVLPVDPTRRRFLTVAAVGSIVGAGTLAAAALTPGDVPQAVTSPSLETRAAIRQLANAHSNLIGAQATNEEAEAIWTDWEAQNPCPASRKGRRKWLRRSSANREAIVARPWQALMTAEIAFAEAQAAVASVPIAGSADVHAMAECSVIYDRVEIARINRAPIAPVVAQEYFRLGKAVQS